MATCDDFRYAIGNAALDDPELGFKLLLGTEYAPAVSPRNVTIMVPGRHGALPLYDAALPSILVTLVVRVLGSTPDELRTNWTNLMALMNTGRNSAILLRRIRGEVTETADARLVSTTAPIFDRAQSWVDTTIVLEIPQGYWSGPNTVQTLSNTGLNSITATLTSSAPIADLTIRVTGPVTSFYILDNQNNTGLSWAGLTDVPSGQSLIIATGPMRAWTRTGTAFTRAGTDVSQYLRQEGSRPFAPTSSLIRLATFWNRFSQVQTSTVTSGGATVAIQAGTANF